MRYGCTGTPAEIRSIQETGFDYVELSGKLIFAMEDDEFRAVEKELSRSGIACEAMNCFCPAPIIIAGPRFDPVAAKAYMIRLARRAKALGTECLGIGSPFSRKLPENYPLDLAWEQAKEFVSMAHDVFVGMNICVEALAPCFCNYINTVQEAKKLAEATDTHVVLDFYNMEYLNEADMGLADYVPFIAHAHISDDDGAPTLRSYLKPEKQAIHQSRIKGLTAVGYDRRLTLETDVPFQQERAAASLKTMKLR